MSRPNQARLNLDALRHNVTVARELAPQSRIMAVVKANAYGHGAVTIAGALENEVDAMAVACLEEAVELRNAGIKTPVLLLEGPFERSELVTAAQLGLWLTIENEQQLEWLETTALPADVHCWLKVNTGMNRLGTSLPQAPAFFQRLQALDNVAEDIVLYTHFAAADNLQSSKTQEQIAAFETLSLGAPRSAANSAGLLAWPDSHYDWVRPGYMLYGNSPLIEEHPVTVNLQPVMSLVSAVISLREIAAGEAVGYGGNWIAQRSSLIATVTVGYGDGYPRQAKNGTPVIVNGQRAALAGCVSMDMITVDVTDLADVQVGNEVILWGAGLPLSEVAQYADTIGYELTTRMPARTPRIVIAG